MIAAVNPLPRIVVAGAVLLALGGCASSTFRAEHERMREENDDLRIENERLARRVVELEAAVAARRAEGDLPAWAGLLPEVHAIRIGGLSHLRDDDRDGRPDRAIIYVTTEDDRGRFLRTVGPMSVRLLRASGDADPVVIAEATLDAEAVRDALRSGFTGTHYTIELPLAIDPGEESPLALVAHEDWRSGRRHEAERRLAERPAEADGS